MKTSHGKLALLGCALMMAFLLFMPMRAGQEDELELTPKALKMSVGDSYVLRCMLGSEDTAQRVSFTTSDSRVATIDLDGTVHALAPGEAVIAAFASGGAHDETQVQVAGVPMTELSLSAGEVLLEKGQYSGLRVSYNADATDTRLQWLSSDEDVARVDASGRIEAVGGGEAFVSVVSANGLRASARVFVDVKGEAVHISPEGLTLGVGAQVPLKLSFLPTDCTDRALRWVSSDTAVLTVDENGVLSARGEGTAFVTVLTEDALTAAMEVKVEAAPSDIQLDPARAALERGDTLQMQLMFLEADGSVDESDHLTVWSSSDTSVASVDQNGLATALKSGECRIQATADGMTVECRLTVTVSIQEITLDQQEIYLLAEETREPIQLRWRISPADADDPSISFSSNNTQVANVSKDGLVSMTGGYGTAVITASAASGASADFIVNVVTKLPETQTETAWSDVEEADEAARNVAPYEDVYRQLYGDQAASTPELNTSALG